MAPVTIPAALKSSGRNGALTTMPSNMKVLVIGASGIIGQHMTISVPECVDAMFMRRKGDGFLYQSLDVTADDLVQRLDSLMPDVIVNLAGENSPDVVERDASGHALANTCAAETLAVWC